MANALCNFIGRNRDEIIHRCRAKVAERLSPPQSQAENDHGVPLFLDQLCHELRQEQSSTPEISKSAIENGHDLLLQGFTISDVVHTYGDICQSVTTLAIELDEPISVDDFRTMNGCLDNAIAGAVSEYAHEQGVSGHGAARQLQSLTDAAVTAFEALRTGRIGVEGSTGTVVLRSLMSLRAAIGALAEEPKQEQEAQDLVLTGKA